MKSKICQAWNLGGPGLYKAHLEDVLKLRENADSDNVKAKLHVTRLDRSFDCDTFYPMDLLSKLESSRLSISNEHMDPSGTKLRFETYKL